MKNLLFIFITLITIANVSYASFPVVESNAKILAIEHDDDDEPSLLVYTLRGILSFSILGFVLYFLIRALRRAYRRDVPWVKKLLRWKNIWWLLLLIPIWFILNLLASGGVGG
jgi:hypothetical protein